MSYHHDRQVEAGSGQIYPKVPERRRYRKGGGLKRERKTSGLGLL